MALAHIERERLIGTMRRVGPDAPTLCEGWSVRDLLIHLIVRELHPQSLASSVLPRLGARKDKLEQMSFEEILEHFATGRQKWSPLRLGAVDSLMNTAEYVIHHEDIRRAQEPPLGRILTHEEQAEIYKSLKRMARLLLRKTKTTVDLRPEGFEHIIIGPSPEGGIDVTASGTPLELLMFAFGRSMYTVDFAGDPHKIEQMKRVARGQA